MNTATALPLDQIVVDEIFPHTAELIWKALTDGALIARWLMEPAGFEAVVGNHFTYKTTAAGAWDGLIRCEVLEVVPNERLVYAWRGGDENNVGYGSRLDTLVSWKLSRVSGGTRIELVHSGFVPVKNDSAFKSMSEGWKKVFTKLGGVVGTPH